jgi:outer membrane protein assembly factor BamB
MSEASHVSPPRRSHRWWLPTAIIVAAGAAIAFIQFSDFFEGWTHFPLTVLAGAGAILLLAVWLLFLSRLRWRTRFIGLGAGLALLVAMAVGLSQATRWEGSLNGTGLPRLVWKWESKPDRGLSIPEVSADRGALEVDLAATSSSDYPRFLGAGGQGTVLGVHLTRDWSRRPPEQIWRQPVGAGWSSFAVVGHFAVTQEQRGDEELVVCYDIPTGSVRWVHTNHARFSETMGGDGPRATPTIADGRVYALGATGILDCLDGATGKVIWSRRTLEDNQLPNMMWGKSSSPLIVDDLVVVSGGEVNHSSLLAFHKKTGEPAWQAGNDKPSYSSPTLATLAGVRQLVSVNAGSVSGHDPATGKVLWEYSWPGGMAKCSQPVPLSPDRLFISAGYGVGCALLRLEHDKDWKLVEVWKNKNLKTLFTNAVIRDGFAYGLDDGILVCLDLATGARRWKGGRYGHGQVLRVDDLLLVQAEAGDVVLVEASPDGHHELTRFPALKEKTWNNPVVSGPYLLVRNDREAACFRLPQGE